MSIKYRVHMVERERGWGSDHFHVDFDTAEEALEYIKECNEKNQKEYAKTGRVPDYYCQPEYDEPRVVDV